MIEWKPGKRGTAYWRGRDGWVMARPNGKWCACLAHNDSIHAEAIGSWASVTMRSPIDGLMPPAVRGLLVGIDNAARRVKRGRAPERTLEAAKRKAERVFLVMLTRRELRKPARADLPSCLDCAYLNTSFCPERWRMPAAGGSCTAYYPRGGAA